MASDVDICNLALARAGDRATIASINPADASAQAQHCSRFYPIARNSLLEMHTWGFASKRIALADTGSKWTEWDYAYAMPSDALNIVEILPPNATDDVSVAIPDPYWQPNALATPSYSGVPMSAGGAYVAQPFTCEADANGNQIIYTDQANAVLRYTVLVTDTTKFSPLFVDCLGWLLASHIAPALIKGQEGMRVADSMMQKFAAVFQAARNSDAGQRRIQPVHNVTWITNR